MITYLYRKYLFCLSQRQLCNVPLVAKRLSSVSWGGLSPDTRRWESHLWSDCDVAGVVSVNMKWKHLFRISLGVGNIWFGRLISRVVLSVFQWMVDCTANLWQTSDSFHTQADWNADTYVIHIVSCIKTFIRSLLEDEKKVNLSLLAASSRKTIWKPLSLSLVGSEGDRFRFFYFFEVYWQFTNIWFVFWFCVNLHVA